jgi:5-methylcytosine-specific restriction enzyme subunit McrC
LATLSVREHTSVSIGAEFCPDETAACITRRQARALAQLSQEWEVSGRAAPLEVGVRRVRTQSHVGVLSFGDDALEILPKVDGLEDGAASSRRWLLSLLKLTKNLSFITNDDSYVGIVNNDFLEYYFRLFCERLLHEINRGLPHRYQDVSEELGIVRGKINHPASIRNAATKAHLVCEFDEFQRDNTHNQLLKAALVAIQPHAKSEATQKLVRTALFGMDGIAERRFSGHDLQRLTLDRTLERMAPVFEMAKAFLRHTTLNPLQGESRLISLLFDMNKVFEEAVGRMFYDLNPDGIQLQRPRKYYMRDAKKEEDYFLLRPDICFVKDGQVTRIVDTKWKRLKLGETNFGVSPDDLYQMAAYATAYKCNDLTLLYPAVEGLKLLVRKMIVKPERIKTQLGQVFGTGLPS